MHMLTMRFANLLTHCNSHMDIIQLKRCLECSLKESRCIDLESLCITAGSKVNADYRY